ncbi:hypothetical protein ACRUMN_02410 [Kluyvera cryocrescens]|uniref:hypothetical protein n=1 Tax=Kluyvera cryocrescens TaxID=580 RepID=UPI003D7FCA6A
MKNEISRKVGVITMHSVINYGSFLQAYATQTIIEKLGYECEIIDYQFPNDWHFKRGVFGVSGIKSQLLNIIHKVGIKPGHRKKTKLKKATKKYLHLSKMYRNPCEIKRTPQSMIFMLQGVIKHGIRNTQKEMMFFFCRLLLKMLRKYRFLLVLQGGI